MSRIVIIAGISMVVAAITIYLIDVFGVLFALLAGTALVIAGGLLSIIDGTDQKEK